LLAPFSELVSYQPARLDLGVLGALANPIREASGIEPIDIGLDHRRAMLAMSAALLLPMRHLGAPLGVCQGRYTACRPLAGK
jgi:hypothetical protein